MFRLIGTLIVLGGLLLGTTQTAGAHGRAYDHYDPPKHYRVNAYRDNHMPRWLQEKAGFRGWYRHSSLRHNHQLQWRELYEISRWERLYDGRRRRHAAYYGNRNYDWYRRYWRDYDRHRRDDRRDVRRRNRSHD
jgi:hypothetical protein